MSRFRSVQCAAVAQLVEALVLKTGCWGFESPAPSLFALKSDQPIPQATIAEN